MNTTKQIYHRAKLKALQLGISSLDLMKNPRKRKEQNERKITNSKYRDWQN